MARAHRYEVTTPVSTRDFRTFKAAKAWATLRRIEGIPCSIWLRLPRAEGWRVVATLDRGHCWFGMKG